MKVREIRRATKSVAVALAAVFLVPVTSLPAATAPTSAALPLAGVTRISGDETTASWVSIPEKVRFKRDLSISAPDVRIDGGGRVAGFVLAKAAEDLDRDFAMAVRTGFCDTPGCAPEETYEFVSSYSPSGESSHEWVVLTPGRYVLYLLADGAPVSVTLRLRGLSGRTHVRPRTGVDWGVSVPSAQTATVAPERKAYWFGESASLDAGSGLFVGVLSADASEWREGVYGSCLQRELHSPPAIAYSPVCPAGGAARTIEGYPLSPVDRTVRDASVWEVTPGGEWGLGLYYMAAADVRSVDAMTFHLAYQLPRG